MRSRRPLWLSFALCALVISGCPRRFDPRAEEFHSRNPEAEALYQRARTAFAEKNYAAAEQAARDFEARFGKNLDEPLLGPMRILSARTARMLGDAARSKAILEPLTRPDPQQSNGAPGVAETARYELGLTAYRLGEFERARDLLPPFATQIVDGEEATELHAVMADLWRRVNQPRLALDEYLKYYRGVSVRPIEQAYIRTQALPLLALLPAAEQPRYRSQLGLEVKKDGAAVRSESAVPHTLIGVVLPLSGKDRVLGERVLRGALWGASAFRGDSVPDGTLGAIELRVRDSGGSPDAAERAVTELAKEGVQAILGSPSRADAQAVAVRAAALGLPGLHVGPSVVAPPLHGFQILRSNKARAEGLARFLTRAGLNSVAVLAPQSAYGQAMTSAFTDVLRGTNVQVVLSETFAENATTFRVQAQKLLEVQPAALYIPTSANQLELIAAQLASSGVLATQRVNAKDGTLPPVRLLLSSAEGLGERLLKNAGRYLQGAVLSPISAAGLPLLSDGGSSSLSTLFSGYTQEIGEAPGALDALGFDAVRLLRTACGRATATGSACTAAALPQLLRTVSTSGATGPLSFDPSGLRAGDAVLYKIEGSSLRAQPVH